MPQELLRSFATGGVSVFVGTVDAEGLPACCRGIAIASRDDFDTVTVYVPAATGQETVANVATTRRVAISCSRPLTHETIQIKGITRNVRLAPAAEEPLVRGRLADFGSVLEEIGFPHAITSRIACWPAFAIEVSVEQVFDQTPGPNAGAEVKR
jgi:hypothetical protein